MAEVTQKARYLDFGPYRLDRHSRILLRDGVLVPLTPKVFDTLAALAEHPGEVLSKDDLLRMVWPGVFVEESNLAQNVSVLRRALGNDPFVETVPKRGYRFIAPVVAVPEKAEEPQALKPPEPASLPTQAVNPPYGGTRTVVVAGILIALLTTAAAAAAWFRHRNPSQPAIRSLAVLPLKNLSGDPAQDYFADGITELLTEQLARRLPLRVISRTSVARYRDTASPVRTIGSELGVDALLEGSVIRTGNRVRITVQLIEAAADRHLWADTYDRDWIDVLVLQKEIARMVAGAVHASLAGGEDRPVSISRESFEAYIRARYFWNLRTPANLATAISWFQKAIDADPANARAYAGLSDCYNQIGTVMIGMRSPKETRKLALAAANRALEIDPNLAEAHAALGYVHMYEWNWERARQELDLAIQLNPNTPSAHLWLGHHHSIHGRFQQALQQIRLAQDLDPLSPIFETQYAWVLIHARRYDEALPMLRSILEKHPDYAWAQWQLGIGLSHKGDPAEAVATLERSAARHRTHAFLGFLGYAYGRAGRRAEALRIIEELRAAQNRGYVSPHAFLFVYLGLGDRDKAFQYLEQSFDERSNGVAWMGVSPDYDPIRSDPRFEKLLVRAGLSLKPLP